MMKLLNANKCKKKPGGEFHPSCGTWSKMVCFFSCGVFGSGGMKFGTTSFSLGKYYDMHYISN